MSQAKTPLQINFSKLTVGGGAAGLLVALASMLVFLLGVPLIRYLFPAAVLVGSGVALVLHFTHHEVSSTSRILTAAKR